MRKARNKEIMRRRRKSNSLYARIAMWFLRFPHLRGLTVRVRGFSCIAPNVITVSFGPPISTASSCPSERSVKAVGVSQLLSSTLSKVTNSHQINSFLPSTVTCKFLSISQSTTSQPNFAGVKSAALGGFCQGSTYKRLTFLPLRILLEIFG